MKKVLIGLALVLGLLLGAAALIPILFKDKVFALAEKEVNKSLNAKVFFDPNAFGLSLFQHFPHLTLSMGNFGVVNRAPFQGDTLAQVGQLQVMLNLMSVLGGGAIEIEGISLIEPEIRVHVLPDGRANWDIALADSSTAATPAPGEPTSFQVGIKKWEIVNGFVSYHDQQNKTIAVAAGLNHTGSGDFTQDVFDLRTSTNAQNLLVEYDTVIYINNKRLTAELNLNMDLPKARYTFQENRFALNDFAIALDGYVAMPDTSIEMDLKFSAAETSFRSLFSLLPQVFLKDYENIKTEGTLAFDGSAKGLLNGASMPAFSFGLQVKDGMVQYPGLPSAITEIATDLRLNHPGGQDLELLQTDLKQLHLKIGANPLDARASVQGIARMNLDAQLATKLDLAELSKAFPVEGLSLRGLFGLDLKAKGKFDQAQHQLPAVQASLTLVDGYVKSADFPAPLEKINVKTKIANETGAMADTKIWIDDFAMQLQGEALRMSGYVENLDNYTWDLKLAGAADLDKITKIFPVEGMQLAGRLVADVSTKGNMKALEASRYQELPTSGTASLSGFSLRSELLPQGLKIEEANMSLNPSSIALTKMVGSLGRSDMQLSGQLSHYLEYVLMGKTLDGKLAYSGKLLDLNELMPKETGAETGSTSDTAALQPVILPRNIDFLFTAAIGQVLFDKLEMKEFMGSVTLRDGVLGLNNLSTNTLGGFMKTNLSYDSRDENNLQYSADFSVQKIDIPTAYRTFTTVQQMAPVAQQMEGKCSGSVRMMGNLTSNMQPNLVSTNGAGNLLLQEAKSGELQSIQGLNKLAKTSLPTNLSLANTAVQFEIKDGRVYLAKPLTLNAGQSAIAMTGSQGIDGTLDYVLATTVEAGAVGQAVNEAVGKLLGTNAPTSTKLRLNVKMGGTTTQPTYSLLSATPEGSSGAGTSLKASVDNKVEDAKKEAEAKVRAEADRLKAETEAKANAEAERLKKEAEQRAKAEQDRLRREAEEKAKEAAKGLKDKFKLGR